MKLRIHYNCPVVLTFSFAAVLIQLMNTVNSRFSSMFFAIGGSFSPSNPLDYIRLFSHVLGHASFAHLMGNLTFLLLLGPILEEKYGSRTILSMIAITAFSTAVLNVVLFDSGLYGASGVVFMFIILASIVDIRRNSVPLSFLLVSAIFIGNEVLRATQSNNISEMAHIVGGFAGAACGFLLPSVRRGIRGPTK